MYCSVVEHTTVLVSCSKNTSASRLPPDCITKIPSLLLLLSLSSFFLFLSCISPHFQPQLQLTASNLFFSSSLLFFLRILLLLLVFYFNCLPFCFFTRRILSLLTAPETSAMASDVSYPDPNGNSKVWSEFSYKMISMSFYSWKLYWC